VKAVKYRDIFEHFGVEDRSTRIVMIVCPRCRTSNLDTSRFCDECGERLAAHFEPIPAAPAYVPPEPEPPVRHDHVTSFGVPEYHTAESISPQTPEAAPPGGPAHSRLVIERGDGPGTEFRLSNDESIIGRWDADNGIFPDVDLDAFDSDAKVSRRHARVIRSGASYMIEDLGSTNGTYVNRGRRLLPGSPQPLADGDEVIVGKTFLRFQIG